MDRKNELIRAPKLLSVLIPTLRTRMGALSTMLDKIHQQVDARTDVEILSLLDCKTMTLGRKRNLLMDMAQGEYLTFVNDDDDIHPKWLEVITAALTDAPDVDVLSIRAECKMRKSPFSQWEHSHIMATSLRCPEPFVQFLGEPKIFIHQPVMWCVWKSEIARRARFLDRTYGEDNPWALEACKHATTERIVPIPIYCYYADDTTSEAGPRRGEFDCGVAIDYISDPKEFVNKHGEVLHYLGVLEDRPKEVAVNAWKPLRKPRTNKPTDSIGWMFMGEMGGPCDKACQMCYYSHQKNLVFYSLPTLINHANLFRHYYGLTGADITGGEPTIFKEIVPLVKHCKDIGLSPRIITHGQNVHDKFRVENGVPLWRRIEDAGLELWRFSLHGGSPKSHDSVLCQEGSFERIMANIDVPQVEQHFNTTLLDTNYTDLPVSILADRKPTVYNIIYFLPYLHWATDKAETDFQVKYRESAPYVARAVETLEVFGWEVNLRYFPMCIAEEFGFAENVCMYPQIAYDPWEWRLNVTSRTSMEAIERQGGLEAAERNSAREWMKDRRNPVCDSCANSLICDGPPVQYQKKYGMDELRPIAGPKRTDILHYQRHRGVPLVQIAETAS